MPGGVADRSRSRSGGPHLIRLACNVLAVHGTTEAERKDARVLLVVIDARRPVRAAQRHDQGRAGL
jgi:hypothetical protein